MRRAIVPWIASLSLVLFLGAAPLIAQTSSGTGTRTITVVGDAEVKVSPDEAVIPLVLRTEGRDVDEARKENDARLKDLRALASGLGIPEESVTADYISIAPQQGASDEYPGLSSRYRKDDGGEQSLGYYASRNLLIRLKDLKVLENLLAGMAKMKSAYVGPAQLRNTDAVKHRERARLQAMRSAKEKAEMMAGELGAKVGRPVEISEGGLLDDYFSSKGGGGSAYAANLYAMLSGAGGESGSVSNPGEVSFSSRVTVIFEIE